MTEATTTAPEAVAAPQDTVTLPDGSTVKFSARDKVKKMSYSLDDGTIMIRFVFRNGTVKESEFLPTNPILVRAAQHGLDQKIGDEFAKLDDVEDCIVAFEEMCERLQAGEWVAERESNGLSGVSLLAAALIRVTGKPRDEVLAKVKELPPKVKAAMLSHPPIAAEVAKIKEERAARSKKPAEVVDVSAVMAQFD